MGPHDRSALVFIGCAWLLLLILSTVLSGSPLLAIVDDAFIYLPVIDNLIAGHGWTYTAGELVNPLTSVLYPLVLLPFRTLGIPADWLLSGAYLVSLLGVAVVQYLAFRAHSRILATALALISSTGAIVLFAWGMETSLFLFCLCASALAFQRRRLFICGVLAGLTALARPDGLALVVLLSLVFAYRERRPCWLLLLGFCLPLAPWLLYAWVKFGQLLPHTVAVKAGQADIGWWATRPPWFLAFLGQLRFPLLTSAFALMGGWWALRQCRADFCYPLLVIGFGAAQVATYSVLGAPVGYRWYFAPGNFAVDTAVAVGVFLVAGKLLAWISGRLQSRFSDRAPWRMSEWVGNPVLGAAALCLVALLFTAAQPRLIRPYRLSATYREVARWIAVNAPPAARVAATEIGYLGHYSQREIRDIHALLHPRGLEDVRTERWDWWFTHDPPEVIVTHEPSWPGEPQPEGWPIDSYRRFQRGYREVYSVGSLVVWARSADTAPIP